MSSSKQIKDLRMQSLIASSPNTPLRRRSALNVSTVSTSPINASEGRAENINDDEAERRSSRRIEPVDIGTNLSEAADSLNNCLKLFAENKISKDNAWTLNIIDSFSKLIKKHHHSLSNFQVCGSTLEASAKVYSLRVDSVYSDVLRMSTDLSRQTAKALSKRGRLNAENDDEDQNDSGDDGEDKENNAEGGQKQRNVVKRRKQISTVTKNPETLNGRLDSYPLVDPFFAKLNSMVGDINSSKRLMQNIVPTRNSILKLQQNLKIWDSHDEDINIEEEFDYKNVNPDHIFSIKSVSGGAADTVLRSELKSYRICDLPLETAEEADMSIHLNANNDLNETITRNMDLQFDMNAPVEPIANERSFVMDFGELDENDFEDLNDDEMVALERCKGLKRQPILIEDMQPETSVHLEYSYRPLDMIDQFWAGPSHWKFRQSRRTHALNSMSGMSQTTSTSIATQVVGQKPKIVRKKKIVKKIEVTLDYFYYIDENNIIVPISKRMKANQLSVQTMAKRWDSKKLKLPADYRVPNDIFDSFTHACSIHIATNPDTTFNGNDDENAPLYDYDNENDRNYCPRIADTQSDTETETNPDVGLMDDNNIEFDSADMPPPPAPIDEIPDIYVGAPERIEKISIAFAKRAKIVDMRQLKHCSWNLISKKNQQDPLNHPCFSETLSDLPKVLSKTMAENMSMPLAFYAILHLCNDKGLILKPNNSLRDFEINFVN